MAAVIVDPCATASGVAAAPPSDLVALRALCDQHGILLIADEVITGFCRTGTMFASQLADVTPDLMDGLQGLVQRVHADRRDHRERARHVRDQRSEGRDAVFAHGHTYGGHPVACAVAAENIAILEEERLDLAAAARGQYLRARLGELATHDTFVDARGIGMLNGLEVLPGGDADAGRFGTAAAACVWLRKRLRDIGLVTLTVHPGRVFLLAPPLIVSEAELDTLVEMLDQGLERSGGSPVTEASVTRVPGSPVGWSSQLGRRIRDDDIDTLGTSSLTLAESALARGDFAVAADLIAYQHEEMTRINQAVLTWLIEILSRRSHIAGAPEDAAHAEATAVIAAMTSYDAGKGDLDAARAACASGRPSAARERAELMRIRVAAVHDLLVWWTQKLLSDLAAQDGEDAVLDVIVTTHETLGQGGTRHGSTWSRSTGFGSRWKECAGICPGPASRRRGHHRGCHGLPHDSGSLRQLRRPSPRRPRQWTPTVRCCRYHRKA